MKGESIDAAIVALEAMREPEKKPPEPLPGMPCSVRDDGLGTSGVRLRNARGRFTPFIDEIDGPEGVQWHHHKLSTSPQHWMPGLQECNGEEPGEEWSG